MYIEDALKHLHRGEVRFVQHKSFARAEAVDKNGNRYVKTDGKWFRVPGSVKLDAKAMFSNHWSLVDEPD